MQDLTTFITQHQLLATALGIVFILLIIVEFLRAKKSVTCLSPSKIIHMINREGANVFDIRTKELYKNSHIIDAISAPPELFTTPKKLEKYRNKPVIIVCQTGNASRKLSAQLLKQGYNAYSLAGGMRAWIAAQMPTVKG